MVLWVLPQEKNSTIPPILLIPKAIKGKSFQLIRKDKCFQNLHFSTTYAAALTTILELAALSYRVSR